MGREGMKKEDKMVVFPKKVSSTDSSKIVWLGVRPSGYEARHLCRPHCLNLLYRGLLANFMST